MTILMDTDSCIEVIRGNPVPLAAYPDADFVVSWISGFEVLSGLRGQRSPKVEARARAFLEASHLLGFDAGSAAEAANVRISLEQVGRPIGAYDTLLAGHALSLGVPILTRNTAEFGRVPGLQVLTW